MAKTWMVEFVFFGSPLSSSHSKEQGINFFLIRCLSIINIQTFSIVLHIWVFEYYMNWTMELWSYGLLYKSVGNSSILYFQSLKLYILIFF